MQRTSILGLTAVEPRADSAIEKAAGSPNGDLQATLQLLADRAQYVTGASGAAIGLLHEGKMWCRAAAGDSVPGVGAVMSEDSGSALSGCSVPIVRQNVVIGVFRLVASAELAIGEQEKAELTRLASMVEVALEEVEHSGPEAGPKAPDPPAEIDSPAPPESKPRTASAPAIVRGRIPLTHRDTPSIQPASAQDAGLPKTIIRTCAGCGFPVSEERMICFDCEAAGLSIRNQAGLAGSGARPPGQKFVWRKHLYTAGTIAMAAATGAVLWFWLK